MPLKYYLSYINVTKVITYPCMPFSRMENVTMSLRYSPSTCQKPDKKYVYYLKLVCCALKCIGRYTDVTIVTVHCSYGLFTNQVLHCNSVTAHTVRKNLDY